MIYDAGYTTARYIKEKYPEIKKVFVIGANAICEELAELGIQSCGGEDHIQCGMSVDEFAALELQSDV